MKDITQYFKNSTANVEKPKTPDKTSGDGVMISPLSTNANKPEENVDKGRKNLKKRIKCKFSKNSEDNSLRKLSISDELSKNEKPTQAVDDRMEEDITNKNSEKENQVLARTDLEVNIENKTGNEVLPKVSEVNAFQFLMNSRNKIIGLNSPGRPSTDVEESFTEVSKDTLAVRKKLLQNWSDTKKAKKRKLDDEEIDKCIKVKLEVRKKRFKTLLNIENEDKVRIEAEDKQIIPPSPNLKSAKRSSKKCGISSNASCSDKIVAVDENGTIELLVNKSGQNELLSKKSKRDLAKVNKCSQKVTKICVVSSSGEDFELSTKCKEDSNDSQVLKKKTHKYKRKKTVKGNKISHEEMSAPKSTKQWKMRIKLANEDGQENLERDDDDLERTEEVMNTVQDAKIEDQGNEISVTDKTEIGDKKLINKICVSDSDDEDVFIVERKIITKESIKTNENNLISDEAVKKITESSCLKSNEFRRVLRNGASLVKNNSFSEISSNESSDEVEEKCKRKKRTLKVAPVFIKAIPKPRVDPEVLEAKRKFLMSDIPDTLRKRFEHKESTLPEFDVFPTISHVQQYTEDSFWNLPNSILEVKLDETYSYEPEILPCKSLINHSAIEKKIFEISEPIQNIKTIVRNLKLENMEYPVYKSYRILKEKNLGIPYRMVENVEREASKRRSKSKRSSGRKESKIENTEEESKQLFNTPKYLMWTENYKPKSFEDLMSNFQAISCLKKWLESWHEAFKNGRKKHKNYSDSESDFMTSDADSVSSNSSLTSTIILTGPCGSGKSSSVYAICNELGLNVIELNASSRRTGKQVLQELQEATQSHQVRKNKESLLSFTKTEKKVTSKRSEETKKSKRMCVLLIEDIDIVFEQDEGFISAISQISAISKRPIVLTTSNVQSMYSRKFMNDFKTIEFHSSSAKTLGIWLHILCLLEGIFVDISSIGEFLEYNRGDVRRTILELQFWVQSGGQMNVHKNFVDKFFHIEKQSGGELCILQTDDDASNISLKEQEGKLDSFRVHSNIISDFEILQLEKFYNIPFNLDLEKIWWNIPKFLDIESNDGNSFNPWKKSNRNKRKLKIISDMYDSLTICDISYRKASYKCDTPVCKKRWDNYLQDSLELRENNLEYSMNQDFLFEWNHYLVDGCLNSCKDRFVNPASKSQRILNMGLPGSKQKSELAKSHLYEEALVKAVPSSNQLDRKSVSLDYLPTLRNIARSEKNRAQHNVKRHNRFYNYLRNLGIDCNNMVLNFASTSLLVNR